MLQPEEKAVITQTGEKSPMTQKNSQISVARHALARPMPAGGQRQRWMRPHRNQRILATKKMRE